MLVASDEATCSNDNGNQEMTTTFQKGKEPKAQYIMPCAISNVLLL